MNKHEMEPYLKVFIEHGVEVVLNDLCFEALSTN